MTTAKDIFFVDSFFLDTQNNVNIDYVEAINRLLQCNVDPFVSNTPNLSKQENNQYTVTFVRVSYQKEYLDSLKQYLNKKITNLECLTQKVIAKLKAVMLCAYGHPIHGYSHVIFKLIE
jgi:hypothetical protein